jgi:hypothetical protein
MNSIGNLILHLCGNMRQWMVSGIGGAADIRQRSAEFAERGPIPKAELLSRLKQVIAETKEAFQRNESLSTPLPFSRCPLPSPGGATAETLRLSSVVFDGSAQQSLRTRENFAFRRFDANCYHSPP